MDNLITAFLWIACGFFCFGIAKQKNRNEWLALSWGLAFGLISVIVYLLLDKKEE